MFLPLQFFGKGLRRIIKMFKLFKAICRFSAIPIEIPLAYIAEIKRKSDCKMHMEQRRALNSQAIWRTHMSWIPECYKAGIIKASILRSWCWHKDRHRDQWIRIETPAIHPHLHSQMIFDQSTKTLQRGRDSFLNKSCWENYKRMTSALPLTPSTKINS